MEKKMQLNAILKEGKARDGGNVYGMEYADVRKNSYVMPHEAQIGLLPKIFLWQFHRQESPFRPFTVIRCLKQKKVYH